MQALSGGVLNIKTQYDRLKLINALIANRDKHIEDYKAAVIVYKEDQKKLIEEMVVVSTAAVETVTTDKIYRVYAKLVQLTEPVDATKLYEQYIGLFTAAVAENIELTMSEANSIINDEWAWAVAAKTSNSLYSSRYIGG